MRSRGAIGCACCVSRGPLLRARRDCRKLRAPPRYGRSPQAEETVADWLTRHGQRGRLREWLWEPLAVAALNQAPGGRRGDHVRAGARRDVRRAPRRRVAGAAAHAAARDVRAPGAPLHRRARRRGAGQRAGARADRSGRGRRRGRPRRALAIDRVVAAVPWFALEPLLVGDVAPLAGIDRRRDAPGVEADRHGESLVRPAGDGRGVRRAARAARCSGCSTSAARSASGRRTCRCVASGADALVGERRRRRSSRSPRARCGGHSRRAERDAPRAAPSIREKRATFSLAPGEPPRPAVATPVAGLFLAGDWIDTGLPGTIESAVAAGIGRRAPDLDRLSSQPASDVDA